MRICLALGAGSNAYAALTVVTLPTPGSFTDGIPTNQVYDRGLVFSAQLLEKMQGFGLIPKAYGDYQFPMGTDTIPVIIYTGANGAHNPAPFEDPMQACGGNGQNACGSFDGTWGLNAAGTIGALQQILQGNGLMSPSIITKAAAAATATTTRRTFVPLASCGSITVRALSPLSLRWNQQRHLQRRHQRHKSRKSAGMGDFLQYRRAWAEYPKQSPL